MPQSPASSPNDETPQKRVARRLLALAAIEKLIAAEKVTLRREAAEVFSVPGDRAAVLLPDGSPLGNVRADKGSAAGWRVTDAGALLSWARDHGMPILEKTVTSYEVDPEFVKNMLNSVEDGEFVDVTTGEFYPLPSCVHYVQAGPPKLVTTTDKAAPEAVRRLLGDQAALIGIES